MERSFHKQDLSLLPGEPGVYVMRDVRDRVLYVGKATSLRSRVRSYFGGSDPRAFVARLDDEVERIDVIVTPTPKDALILEKTLVRRLQPRYNVDLRDDKNHSWIRIDGRHPFPRLERVRRRARDGATYLGPYLSAAAIKAYMAFLSRTLQLRICSDRAFANRSRPCLQHQMGRCMAPCVLAADVVPRYAEAVEMARVLLKKEDKDVAARVEDRMKAAAGAQRYEDAARYRDLLRGLGGIWSPAATVGAHGLHGDVFGGHESDGGLVVQVLHVRDGKVIGSYQRLKPGPHPPLDEALSSFILQFYDLHEPPGEVLASLPGEALALVSEALSEVRRVRALRPQRGPKKTFLDMATRNAEVAWERWQMGRRTADAAMEQLRTVLGLPPELQRVECFDISSFQAKDAVGSMSVALDGALTPAEYRVWHVKSDAEDDFSMIREVLARRIARIEDGEAPRLLLLDGGRAHLSQVLPLVTARPDANLFLAAIAKARPEQGLPDERVFRVGSRAPVALRHDGPAFLLLARLRDEAHRFGVKHHRHRRKARTLASELLEVPGVGPKRRTALLKAFGSVKAIREATAADLKSRTGLPLDVAAAVLEHLKASSGG
jgi:excinuclease ABC subunit C